MSDTALYKEDWIGLRRLDEAGRVVRDQVGFTWCLHTFSNVVPSADCAARQESRRQLKFNHAGGATECCIAAAVPPSCADELGCGQLWSSTMCRHVTLLTHAQVPDALHMHFTDHWFVDNVIPYLRGRMD